jgi:MPBQ/MSBQ methyltransferase
VVFVALYTALKGWADKKLWTPSRTYNQEDNSVGREYDAWEEEGILEYYWGEHIHLGYYEESVRARSALLPPKKNFIQAKYDFIDEMLKFGRFDLSSKPAKILDVGCGIGGTSRYLAKKFGPETTVLGITLSSNQVKRASALAIEQGKGIFNSIILLCYCLLILFSYIYIIMLFKAYLTRSSR